MLSNEFDDNNDSGNDKSSADNKNPDNKIANNRSRHQVVLDYLKTLPGMLTGVAALIGATTGLVVALLR